MVFEEKYNMAVTLLRAARCIWPLARKRLAVGWPFGRVSLEDAARLAYEAAERKDALDLVCSRTSPPNVRLMHFKYVFMVDDGITLYGVQPPSTKSRPIPSDELASLHPANTGSALANLSRWDGIAYEQVTVSRRDLLRVIKSYPRVARQFGGRFRMI